jgi:hypothetical protein
VEKSVRASLPQPVEVRRFGLANGVVARVVAPTPAIQNDQHHRPPVLHHKTPLVEATGIADCRRIVNRQWRQAAAAT